MTANVAVTLHSNALAFHGFIAIFQGFLQHKYYASACGLDAAE